MTPAEKLAVVTVWRALPTPRDPRDLAVIAHQLGHPVAAVAAVIRLHGRTPEPLAQQVAEQAEEAAERHQPRRLGRPMRPCGTRAAYQRHLDRGEWPCDPCAEASAAYYADRQRERTARRRAHEQVAS